ncbi:ABC transporter substrate-binding protein [Olsenella sp. YH-ols2217]|uniref:ABC transporter substrate-binding protein n=1 Tax=Kribbibacterium absianum TaxID=3044210 RepID=A0ABT6ZMY7_9ACTN|nr:MULTISPECIES: ABC transporter substrate-binding protein [unclassified Olsenella]MDJ1121860.1 ABC transporter substrate-binding protein [Olsenella sp. YH-ols2216]MDJ1129868.1 ABC transporter substrate-binding protein [Olsenella sp. YH-ols2217]
MNKHHTVTRRTFVCGTAAAALLGLAACSNQQAKEEAADATTSGSTLGLSVVGLSCIDPYNVQDDTDISVCRQVFDPLVTYDFQKDEVVPCAAESWSANDDGTVFTFKIREGATFQNGDKVDAAAFQRGWNRLVNPKTMDSPSAVASALSAVKGYQDVLDGKADEMEGLACPDEHTFEVTLSEPFFEFPMMCTLMQTAPVPQAALDDPTTFFHSPIGNGAYQIDGEWVDGQYVNLKAYAGYTGDPKPSVENLHIMIQKDVDTGYREFQAGNVDYCDVPTAQIASIKKEYGESEDGYTITPGHQLLMGTMPAVSYLVFNLDDEALKDEHLRQAMSLAVNRDNLVNTVLQGSAAAADNLVPPACQGYKEGQWAYCAYDVDKAKELVAQYYPNGTPELAFLYNADGGHADTVQAIAADLQAAGINVKLESLENAALQERINDGDFQIVRTASLAQYPSIDDILRTLCSSTGADNSAHYENDEVNALLSQARGTSDATERTALYQQANAIVAEACPYAPLTFSTLRKLGSSKIKEAYVAPNRAQSDAAWQTEA